MEQTRELSSLTADLDALREEVARLVRERDEVFAEHTRALRELTDALRARDEFLATAAHELRNPMGTLVLQVQSLSLAVRKEGGPIAPDWLLARLTQFERQISHFVKRANTLLDISRMTSGKLDLDREDVDLSALVREALENSHAELERAGSRALVRADEPAVGRWDRLLLDQIFTNLLSNAIKYGMGKPIEIAVQASPEEAHLIVRDQGIGIAAEDQARIFDRFERAVTRRQHGGFGVGLWIVRQLVNAHGGSITVESSPNAGSTFKVVLPRNITTPTTRRSEV